MPDFSNTLQQDEDGNWSFDDGKIQADFTSEEMSQILSIAPLSDEVICEIAEGIKHGAIFCSDQCPPSLFGSVFMVTMFFDDKKVAEMSLRDITLFYQYMRDAGPRGCNGYPSFMGCRVMCRDDHQRLRKELKTIGAIDGQADEQTECEQSPGDCRSDG